MPGQLDTPKTDIIQPEITEDYDKIEMEDILIRVKDQKIVILYAKYMGETLISTGNNYSMEGADFGAVALAVTTGDTLYEEIKSILYPKLLAGLGVTGAIT